MRVMNQQSMRRFSGCFSRTIMPVDSMPRSRLFMLCAVTVVRRASCAPEMPGSCASVFSTMTCGKDDLDAARADGGIHQLAEGLHEVT